MRNVVHLLRLSSHEAVCGWNVAQVKQRHVLARQIIFMGQFEEMRESLNQLLFVDALHVLFWVELVSELSVVFLISLVNHHSEVFSVK